MLLICCVLALPLGLGCGLPPLLLLPLLLCGLCCCSGGLGLLLLEDYQICVTRLTRCRYQLELPISLADLLVKLDAVRDTARGYQSARCVSLVDGRDLLFALLGVASVINPD